MPARSARTICRMVEDSVSVTRTAGAQSSRMRADAQHNRDRAIEGARVVFAELGAEASMSEVARRAGIGVATLFRRFPTKNDLLLEVFADDIDGCVRAMDEALAEKDSWRALQKLLRDVCARQASDRALASVLVELLAGDMMVDISAHIEEGCVELIKRAKAQGQLRPDLDYSDVLLVLMANAGVVKMTTESVSIASKRIVDLFLMSFEA